MATVVISFLFTTYYVIIITWAVFYMFSCFQSRLPWEGCNPEWSSELCYDGTNNTNYTVAVARNVSRSPTEDFYM
jgi:solute carrier family 6 GABA transporter-like protein 6/8/11/12/13